MRRRLTFWAALGGVVWWVGAGGNMEVAEVAELGCVTVHCWRVCETCGSDLRRGWKGLRADAVMGGRG